MERVLNDFGIYVPSFSREIRHLLHREKALLDQQMFSLHANNADFRFKRSEYSDVCSFFDEASRDYDSDLENYYWAFAHEILRFILKKFITEHFSGNQAIRLFDAGAGTGNWSKFILGLNGYISGILFDMNRNMLKKAYPKIMPYGNSVRIIEGNLEVPGDFPSEPSNLVICMHNVIGLGRNTDIILRNVCSYLEDGGLAFIMATNKYHAFNFTKRFRGETETQRVLKDGTVKFKSDMPEMFCYSPAEFEGAIRNAGFSGVTVLGFPVTVYPTPPDTKLLRRETSDYRLANPFIRAGLLDLEKRLCLDPGLAYRGGSSLIAICKKKILA